MIQNGELDRFLAEADSQGIAIGAICAGPLLLGKAGLLRPRPSPDGSGGALPARRFTYGYGSEQLPFVGSFFEGGIFVDNLVVRDGNIVTAQARAHTAFGVEIARLCGALDGAADGPDREDARLHAYYNTRAQGTR